MIPYVVGYVANLIAIRLSLAVVVVELFLKPGFVFDSLASDLLVWKTLSLSGRFAVPLIMMWMGWKAFSNHSFLVKRRVKLT